MPTIKYYIYEPIQSWYFVSAFFFYEKGRKDDCYEEKNGKSVEIETILDFVADINAEMEAPVIAKMKTFD